MNVTRNCIVEKKADEAGDKHACLEEDLDNLGRGYSKLLLQGDSCAPELSCVDLNFECSTVRSILPCQPNPHPRPDESPCSNLTKITP